MNRKDILSILQLNSLSPSKKLGQNFIWSDDLISKIADAADVSDNTAVLEIGPGLGALTEELCKRTRDLTSVEFDKGLFNYLCSAFAGKNVKFIHADFLKLELTQKYDRVVSNLPYYCASEMLFKIAESISPERITVMIQKEMADRIMSAPGTEAYGALTVNLSLHYEPQFVINVPNDCFYPEPDVKSTVLNFIRRDIQIPHLVGKNFRLVVKAAFWGRRKTISKALSSSPHMLLKKDLITAALSFANIEQSERGENLSPDDFMKIARFISENQTL